MFLILVLMLVLMLFLTLFAKTTLLMLKLVDFIMNWGVGGSHEFGCLCSAHSTLLVEARHGHGVSMQPGFPVCRSEGWRCFCHRHGVRRADVDILVREPRLHEQRAIDVKACVELGPPRPGTHNDASGRGVEPT
jgi:hypothetical protein